MTKAENYKRLEWMQRLDDEGIRWQNYYPDGDFEAQEFESYICMNSEQRKVSNNQLSARWCFVHGTIGSLWGW
jgi:hypothetical protein